MSGKSNQNPEAVVREIRLKTRRKFSAEEKIRIVLEGLKGETSIAELYAPHIKSLSTYSPKGPLINQCGVDETRTRDLLRDRQAF